MNDQPITHTGSRATRRLGFLALIGLGMVLFLAFLATEEDLVQGDMVRLIYVHLGVIAVTYLAFSLTALGSLMVLWKRSMWWDVAASSSAEIGVVFCALTLATGSIWGRRVWNTWWEWGDVRLMTTLMLFLTSTGYLAYRRVVADSSTRARNSAVVGLIAFLNVPVVNRSVEWWSNRTIHQKSSILDGKIEDLTLFTIFFSIFVFLLIYAWMMIHRFRLGWLGLQAETVGVAAAIEARRRAGQARAESVPTFAAGVGKSRAISSPSSEAVSRIESEGQTPEAVSRIESEGQTPEAVSRIESEGQTPDAVSRIESEGQTPEAVSRIESEGQTR